MERRPVPNGEIRDHPGKRQMVAVTANGPTRHQMSIAPERLVPANPVSHILSATDADKHPVTLVKPPESNVTPFTTRSGRLVKPVPRLINLMMPEFSATTKRQMNIEGELFSFTAMTYESAEECNPILAYKAVNPDILRLHEAMKAKDQKEFKTAMEKEVNDQIVNGNFSVIPRSKVPKGFRSQGYGHWHVKEIFLPARLRNIRLVSLSMAPGCEKEKTTIKLMHQWHRGCQSDFSLPSSWLLGGTCNK